MKLQDLFPYDRTLLSLEGLYEPIGDDGFLIDSNCIWVRDQMVNKGDTYFLFSFDEQKNTTGTAVYLVDCFYHMDMFYLLVEDVFNHEVRLLNHTLDNGLTFCKWRLVDSYSVEKMMEEKYNNNSENMAS